ncbi:MAG TPA: response regulator [Bacteroidia bacterium]|nr:response regulator [Bacteroidia bacterium]
MKGNSTSYKSIMVIDDFALDRQTLSGMIETLNITDKILQRDSMLNAVSYLQDCVVDRLPFPEIIFLDLNLPVLSGEDFLDVLAMFDQKLRCNTRIIVATGVENGDRLDKIKAHHMVNGLLHKPIRLKELEQAVQKSGLQDVVQ